MLLVGLAAAAVVSRGQGQTEAGEVGPRIEVIAADGGFAEPSHAADAVFEVTGLGSGESISGTVRVRNAGDDSGLVSLARTRLSDSPGPNGGRLSERLELEVLDVTDPQAPAVAYTGGVGPLTVRPLGVLGAGASRTYSVKATVLSGQTPTVAFGGGDPYEGSSTRIFLRWRAVEGLPPARLTKLLRRRDRKQPKLSLTAAPRQSVIETGRLDAVLRCSETCRSSATARVSLRGSTPLPVAVEEGPPPSRRAELRLVFGADLQRDLRAALEAGRSVAIEFRTRARDRAGNDSALRETVNLRPKPG